MTLSDLQRPDLSVHFSRVTIARAVALGCDEKKLLHAVRLSADMLADSRTLVSPKQLGSLLRYIWRELDDEMMGFSAPHRFGVFALMARQMVDSATLGDALQYAVRFSNLTSPAARWQLGEGDETALSLQLMEPEADPDHFLEEFLLLIWHRFSNWLIGERVPLVRTEFHFSSTPHKAVYRGMFPGEVSFDNASSAIVFDSKWLDYTVVRSRLDLRRYLQRLPDEWFIKQDFGLSVSERLLRELGAASSSISLQQLAARWDMSSRTLHRQLQREGTSFRGLRDQLRREQAIDLLLAGGQSVGQIALQLGMTEPAFSRAFRTWTGMTPLAYRHAHQ